MFPFGGNKISILCLLTWSEPEITYIWLLLWLLGSNSPSIIIQSFITGDERNGEPGQPLKIISFAAPSLLHLSRFHRHSMQNTIPIHQHQAITTLECRPREETPPLSLLLIIPGATSAAAAAPSRLQFALESGCPSSRRPGVWFARPEASRRSFAL